MVRPPRKLLQGGLPKEGHELVRILQQVEQLGADHPANSGHKRDRAGSLPGVHHHRFLLWRLEPLLQVFPAAQPRHGQRTGHTEQGIAISAEQMLLRRPRSPKEVGRIEQQPQDLPAEEKPEQGTGCPRHRPFGLADPHVLGCGLQKPLVLLALQLAPQKPARRHKGKGDHQAKRVDQLQRRNLKTQEILNEVVKVGVHQRCESAGKLGGGQRPLDAPAAETSQRGVHHRPGGELFSAGHGHPDILRGCIQTDSPPRPHRLREAPTGHGLQTGPYGPIVS